MDVKAGGAAAAALVAACIHVSRSDTSL